MMNIYIEIITERESHRRREDRPLTMGGKLPLTPSNLRQLMLLDMMVTMVLNIARGNMRQLKRYFIFRDTLHLKSLYLDSSSVSLWEKES